MPEFEECDTYSTRRDYVIRQNNRLPLDAFRKELKRQKAANSHRIPDLLALPMEYRIESSKGQAIVALGDFLWGLRVIWVRGLKSIMAIYLDGTDRH